MITKFNNYIVESKKSLDELEMLNPDELGKLLVAEVENNAPNVQYMQDLLDVGCPIDGRDAWSRTALHYAAIGNVNLDGKLEIVKFLVSKGADVNARDRNGCTPLHKTGRNLETIKFLVSNGGDVNLQNANGETPLHCAVHDQYYFIIKFLLSVGASVDVQDVLGLTPWNYALSDIRESFPKLSPYI